MHAGSDPAAIRSLASSQEIDGAGSPIVTTTDGRSDPIVWIVGANGDDRLHAFRGDDSESLATPPATMRGLHHFQTLIASEDRLYRRRRDDLRIRVLRELLCAPGFLLFGRKVADGAGARAARTEQEGASGRNLTLGARPDRLTAAIDRNSDPGRSCRPCNKQSGYFSEAKTSFAARWPDSTAALR